MSQSEAQSAVIAAIDKALQHVADLCTRKARWTMSVPVNEAEDSDCVIADALMGAKKALLSAIPSDAIMDSPQEVELRAMLLAAPLSEKQAIPLKCATCGNAITQGNVDACTSGEACPFHRYRRAGNDSEQGGAR
jgi:hypothetical protein